ncbi:trehalose-phosphatase [Paraoerskovia marina]|uniref:trehalose-phosphatase n=1 Tax=Paraoerskovia marina TaxID=545619 RepID=UPI0004924E44|nr:trehalose-phosphatase [Paraoerskovia marina]
MTETDPAALEGALADLAAHRPVLVALDFDGCLAPLVDDPSASRMLPGARDALTRMAPLAPHVQLALVSGRHLADLAALADPPLGTWLVGSHGAETGEVGPDGLVTVPFDLAPDDAETRRSLIAGFEEIAAEYDGAHVETKPTAAVLHTRRATRGDAEDADRRADAVAESLGLSPMHGKDVVETSVVETSKGEGLEALRARLAEACDVGPADVRVLYAGDDTTDERAFSRPGAVDLAIKVGDGETAASFRVSSPQAVADLLGRLATHLSV